MCFKINRISVYAVSAVIFLFAACNAHAAPAISNITGTLEHGSTITITGAGFGTKSAAAPWRWDPIEDVSEYDSLNDGDTIPYSSGGYWDLNNSGRMKFNTTSADQRGVSIANVRSTNDQPCPGAEDNKKLGTTTPEWQGRYVTFWINLDHTLTNQNSKTMRIWGAYNDTSNKFSLQHSWANNGPWTAYRTNGGTWDYGWQELPGGFERPFANTWMRYELWLNQESNPPSSNDPEVWVRQYIDGRVHTYDYSVTGVGSGGSTDMDDGTAGRLNWITFGFDKNCTGTNIPVVVSLDDIYIDNTRARVELCDASTWSSVTHCEIQIPSAWADDSISIELNQGSFDNFNNYLYVIDSDGVANTRGYPLCSACPQPPTILLIN